MRSRVFVVYFALHVSIAFAQPSPEPAEGVEPAAVVPAAAALEAAHTQIENENDKESDFDKLRTPASPAFVVLGVSPTEIQRPNTPRGVALALAGLGDDEAFALEFSPFWLMSHPDLSGHDYRQNHLAKPWRTLTFSVGTSHSQREDVDAGGMTVTHDDLSVAAGVRSIIFQTENAEKDECLKGAEAFAAALNPAALVDPTGLSQEAYDKEVKAKIEEKLKEIGTTEACVVAATTTKGVTVDVAAAMFVLLPDARASFDNATVGDGAVWMNASYDGRYLGVTAMGRFTSQREDSGRESAVDAGVRVLAKCHNWAGSLEALVRRRLDDVAGDDQTAYKIDAAIEYQVQDDTWLSLTFGKDFEFSPGDGGSLFSLANLQWSLGKRPGKEN